MLEHLHMGHLGRDKMKSLARLLCWWPSINADIAVFATDCVQCGRKPRQHTTWKPWPIPFQPMQRIHVDYAGLFFGKYYALVVEDAFRKFPDVFLTTSACAEFTKKALRKLFSREGIAQVIVSDNGRHFTAEALQDWLKSIGCYSVFTTPRHPCSNGQAENFIHTLKVAVSAAAPTTLESLECCIDTFLLQYRNAVQATTGKTPAMLFKGRNLRSSANVDTTEVLFYRGNGQRPCDGLILGKIGSQMFNVMDLHDGKVHRRHRDQIQLATNVLHEEARETSAIGNASETDGRPTVVDSMGDNDVNLESTVRRRNRSRRPPRYLEEYDLREGEVVTAEL